MNILTILYLNLSERFTSVFFWSLAQANASLQIAPILILFTGRLMPLPVS
jgi:hypothetical protein